MHLIVNQKGLTQLVNILTKISRDKDKVIADIEATGSLWENVYSFLKEKRYTIILINPHHSKKFHELARRKAKIDKIDSIVIAGLLRSGETKKSYIPEEDILSAKELLSPEGGLLEIPGVGPKTVATFIGEAGDITRFSSNRELIGFIGWHPKISESGAKRNPHPKMSKKGSAPLRAALYIASVFCLKHNSELRALYLNKRSQGDLKVKRVSKLFSVQVRN